MIVTTAVYELPRPIWVSSDIFGQRFDTRIGPIRATVVTPERPSSDGPAIAPVLSHLPYGAFGPVLGIRPPRLDSYSRSTPVLDPEWATEYSCNEPTGYIGYNPPGSMALRTIGLELREDPRNLIHSDNTVLDDPDAAARYSQYDRTVPRLIEVSAKNIEDWFNRLAEWVAVVRHQDLDQIPVYPTTYVGPGLRVWTGNNWLASARDLNFTMYDPMDIDQFRTVLDHVGHRRRPQPERLFLTSSASAHARGHLRRTVLDAATAVEICLARLVRESNSAATRPDPGLHGFSKWLAKHALDFVPDEDFGALKDTRNEVIHRGVEPTTQDARSALTCASRIIEKHGLDRTVSDPNSA